MVSVSLQITKQQLVNILENVIAEDPNMLREALDELDSQKNHQVMDDEKVDTLMKEVFERFDNTLRALA